MYITRVKHGDAFRYRCKKEDLERIKKLRIPPNWINVKIDSDASAKIQATGVDSKGRKQYIYNSKWIEKSKKNKALKIKTLNHEKYSRVIKSYVSKKDLSRECVIANIIKLMDDLNIRVGNESYKKENGTYGITTLMKHHLNGNTLSFKGKKGIEHVKKIVNHDSINFINRVKSIKGPELFHDSCGNTISSKDLNSFLKEKVQTNITCKDIRTYNANKIFLRFMSQLKRGSTEKERAKNILKAIDHTAESLGNTRKICRDSYIFAENLNKFK